MAVDRDLAGIPKDAGGDCRLVGREVPGSPIDQAVRIERSNEPLDKRLQHLARKLTRMRPDDIPGRIDRYDRRPRPHGVAPPDAKLPIVDDRMQVVEA